MAPTWLSGVKAVAQSVAGVLPALLLVLFAGVLSLLGLACDQGRRAYALACADRFIDLATVLVGWPQGPSRGVTGGCGGRRRR
ncbi:MAG: hypothetical protein ACRDRP_08565 [Pseudonocardiaceae bacterium]